jgi:Uma2 family endonuclease
VTAPVLPKSRMKVPEFLAWASGVSRGRYELSAGEIVVMSPERVRHNLVKFAVARALSDSVRAAGLNCTVYTDGVTVVIDEETAREPDAAVQWGAPRDLNSMTVDEPLIVVEVTSPSSAQTDAEIKLVEYFSLQSVRHYLIVHPERGAVVHHRKSEAGDIVTRIMHEGEIDLSPPGTRVTVKALLGPAFGEKSGSDGRETTQ